MSKRWILAATAVGMGVAAMITGLGGCASKPAPTLPAKPPGPSAETPGRSTTPGPQSAAETPGKAPIKLGPPERPRDWAHARHQAAQRLVAAHPQGTYMGKPPDLLLAIPVLTIELHGDGSVRNISVMRYPSQARDTVDIAVAAIRRAAPYGDVSKLPKPWKFNETFLFNNDRKFKPMTLDR